MRVPCGFFSLRGLLPVILDVCFWSVDGVGRVRRRGRRVPCGFFSLRGLLPVILCFGASGVYVCGSTGCSRRFTEQGLRVRVADAVRRTRSGNGRNAGR